MTDQERIAQLEAQIAAFPQKLNDAVEAAVANARAELGQAKQQLAEAVAARQKVESAHAVLQDRHTRLAASHERKRAGLADCIKGVGQQLATLQQAIGDDV